MGTESRKHFRSRADRRGEKFHRLCARAESAPRWTLGVVIDDWAMAPLSEPERRHCWETCEDRYQARSLILTSQLPVTRWNEQIGDPTVAHGILDRLVHNGHRIEMRGDSMSKSRGTTKT